MSPSGPWARTASLPPGHLWKWSSGARSGVNESDPHVRGTVIVAALAGRATQIGASPPPPPPGAGSSSIPAPNTFARPGTATVVSSPQDPADTFGAIVAGNADTDRAFADVTSPRHAAETSINATAERASLIPEP